MHRFFEFKYSFRLTLRKLEPYTRVHKKDVSFVALKS